MVRFVGLAILMNRVFFVWDMVRFDTSIIIFQFNLGVGRFEGFGSIIDNQIIDIQITDGQITNRVILLTIILPTIKLPTIKLLTIKLPTKKN